MFALSNCRLFLQALPRQSVTPKMLMEVIRCYTVLNIRGLTTSSQETPKKDEIPIKMENPYKQPQKTCILCNISVDYKNVQLLSQFISPQTGRVYGRHETGLCGRKQKEVSKAIKKACSMSYMSVTLKDPQFMKDPDICGTRQFE
ncbi:28S ribosomal protein S18c, mitochondrial-like [Myxocyprinus asiaticus]|uniref:28S ribosomal protein S18c, mitochondrial-like n=1 Tax=Myxocyprinus asiaticus TaxID=70543 RepID=UPI002223A5A7|nr:28S ribosomal protein S18c, mitochondrial-like [Myxocyprinus asiaticus]